MKNTSVGSFNPLKARAYEILYDNSYQQEIDKLLEKHVKMQSPKLYARLKRSDERSRAHWEDVMQHADSPELVQMQEETDRIFMESYTEEHHSEFALLGLEPNATKREVKNAYRRASRRYHPDCGKPTADAEKFKQIHDAYRALLKVAPDT